MPFIPCRLHRAVRAADGRGGWTAAHTDARILFGLAELHGPNPEFLCRAFEDVRPEDLIEIEGRYYRVLGAAALPRAGLRRHPLEAVARPFVPPPPVATTTPAPTTTTAP